MRDEIKINNLRIQTLTRDVKYLINNINLLKTHLARTYLKNDHYTEKLEHNNIQIEHPQIDDKTLRMKIMELEKTLKTSI